MWTRTSVTLLDTRQPSVNTLEFAAVFKQDRIPKIIVLVLCCIFLAMGAQHIFGPNLNLSQRILSNNTGPTTGVGTSSVGEMAAAQTSQIPNPVATTPALELTEPTPVPTPTAVPVPVEFKDVAGLAEVATAAQITTNPLGCNLRISEPDDIAVEVGTVALRCLEETGGPVEVKASAAGRIVAIVDQDPVVTSASKYSNPYIWSWTSQARLGKHVVINHGPVGSVWNAETVYANLGEIDPNLKLGQTVDISTRLGSLTSDSEPLRFSMWVNNTRQDGATYPLQAPGFEEQFSRAQILGQMIVSPTAPGCPLTYQHGLLPGAPRNYRNGYHRGIDFMCTGPGVDAYAALPGTVVYLIDDYDDATPADRNAVLAYAGQAQKTPHWVLTMLYGNVVVIDHGTIEGVGRVTTVAAHLETVDPAVQLGSEIAAGQRLGEQGNRGTNASAQGRRGASDPGLHLHWEFYIDGWYLGADLPPNQVIDILDTFLCTKANPPGC